MKLLISAAIVAATLPSAVNAQTFDFEGASTDSVTSYTATQGGLTLTLTRQGGQQFAFSNIGSSAPGFANSSIAPFDDPSVGPFVADFSTGLSSFSFQAGDFAPSDSDTLTLSIYSGLGGTGTLLGTTSSVYGLAGFPTISTLSLSSATAFRSAVFNGGSADFPNSVYYDNVTVEAFGGVPEPSTWAVMIIGLGFVGGAMRRSPRRVRVTFAA